MQGRWMLAALAALVPLGLVQPSDHAPAATERCRWLAGDLHVHTTYSHDSYGGPADDNTGPDEAYTLGHSVTGQFTLAATRGLDYLAITDHNDVRSQNDDGFGAFDVLAIPGYENSLRGHAQMLGATSVLDNGQGTAGDVQRLADELRAGGGAFQINHPAEGSTDFPHDRDWSYGHAIVPDTVEVWNISRLWQPPLPSASSNDDAVRFWEGFLDRGDRVAATGGSDNHYVATSGVQGVGQPTTWVCADSADTAGLLEGLRAGRTFISHQPPALGGPRLFVEGDGDGDGSYDALVGDRIPPDAAVRVRVEEGAGSMLRVIASGGRMVASDVPVTDARFSWEGTAPRGATWLRAELYEPDAGAERRALCGDAADTTYCRNDLLVTAMTSALFVGDRTQPTLEYVGDESARAGSVARLAGRLTLGGTPLAGEEIEFTLRGETYRAVTDAEGVASLPLRVPGPPGSYELTARYAGSGEHAPATVTTTFTVTRGPLGR